eukprot:jgi/Ulvmu1/10959/UM007_0138.1
MDEPGPSVGPAAGSAYAGLHVEVDGNISVAEQLSLAAVRDMLAKERAELERERKLREEYERRSVTLARQLQQQQSQVGACEPVSSAIPAHDAMLTAQQADPPQNHAWETTPTAPCAPQPHNAVASGSASSPILPDSIPVLITTSPNSSPLFLNHGNGATCLVHSMAKLDTSVEDPIPGQLHTPPALPPPVFKGVDEASCSHAWHGNRDTGGMPDDVMMYQRQLEAQAAATADREAEDERLARRLQAEAAREADMQRRRQSDLDAEMAAKMVAEMQQADEERAARDAKLAAQAWADEQKRDEEARLREEQGLEAALKAQEEEERHMQEEQAARQAQAAENERLAQRLDAVSKATQQDITDLDRAAVLADHEDGAMFECPVYRTDCSKAEEGECVGQWSRWMCNHWVSKEALVQYIVTEAEEQRFRMRCPLCASERCGRCAQHGQRDGCCYIPQRQIRGLLSEEQMARLLYLQEQWYRTANKDKIVQCPHPDCKFFYALEAEDAEPAAPGEDGEQSRWHEGRDMWCDTCRIRYCLHCGDRMGTLVKWHDGKTCTEFLQDTENAKAAAERRRLERVANEGHEQNRGKTWQRCPKCEFEAWKADGQCNRVVCKENCGTNFCFLCGEDITKLRYKHYEDAAHPCHLKVWHMPLAGVEGRPQCRCGSCRRK